MSIGYMEVKPGEDQRLRARGRIKTIRHNIAFALEPVDKGRDSAPTHRVTVKIGDDFVTVGDAWENTIKRGDSEGRKMFSIRFTDPDLPDWMGNVSAFPTGNYVEGGGDEYEIVRNRERQDAA